MTILVSIKLPKERGKIILANEGWTGKLNPAPRLACYRCFAECGDWRDRKKGVCIDVSAMCMQNGDGNWRRIILQARLCELHCCVAREIYPLSLCMRGNAAVIPLYLSNIALLQSVSYPCVTVSCHERSNRSAHLC